MNRSRLPRLAMMAIAALVILAPSASAHFLWVTIDPATQDVKTAAVHAFLNETPDPAGPEFVKFVKDLALTVDGQPLPTTLGEETLDASWAGKLPAMIDAVRDLGPITRGGKTYRLFYTARAQTAPAAEDDRPSGDKLRVRMILKNNQPCVQVHFDGKPVANARIKIYAENGETREVSADDHGLAEVPGLAEGKTALWANWADATPGESGGKAIEETRYYATLTFTPPPPTADGDKGSTAFAEMPSPAVNSFGGAVLGDWLYVYSGHTGRTHQYSTETTSRHFRRLNLADRTTWEDLPITQDLQGVALVADDQFLYRVGGMKARNQPDDEHDLHSVADFARFDPATKTWTDLPPLPEPRSTHDAVRIGRKIYAVGGWCMKGATEAATYVDHIAVIDLDHLDSGWTRIEQPFRRRALSVAGAEGKLYVLGGLNADMKVERRVDVYDPESRSWSRAADLPTFARNDGFGTSAFGIEGAIYFSGVAGTIHRLNPDGSAWEAIGAWFVPRITHRVLPGPHRTLLAVGGNLKGTQVATIESVPLPPRPIKEKTIAAGR